VLQRRGSVEIDSFKSFQTHTDWDRVTAAELVASKRPVTQLAAAVSRSAQCDIRLDAKKHRPPPSAAFVHWHTSWKPQPVSTNRPLVLIHLRQRFVHPQRCHICQTCFIPWHLRVRRGLSTRYLYKLNGLVPNSAGALSLSQHQQCGTHYLPN